MVICEKISANGVGRYYKVLFSERFVCEIRLCIVALLTLKFLIENRGGCLHIGAYPKGTDTAAGKRAYEYPAYKAEIQAEKTPLVALHHLFTLVKAFAPTVFGVIRLYVIDEGIAV